MHRRIAGDNATVLHAGRLPVQIGHGATGLADKKDAGGLVSRGQCQLPEAVELTGGDGNEIEGR
jgi:hypothetical protein